MSRAKPRTLADLPLFASDEDIGEAVLGHERRKEFREFAGLQERHGMPKVSARWGGRYVPAVKAYLDETYGYAKSAAEPSLRKPVEGDFHERKSRAAKGARTEVAQPQDGPGGPVLVR